MVTNNNNSSDSEQQSLLPEASKNRYQSTNIITTSSSNHSSISNTNEDDNLFNNHQPLLTHHYGREEEEEDHPHDVIPQHPQRVQQQDQPYNAAYEILEKANLLVTTFRKESFSDIFQEEDLNPNSTLAENFTKKWQWGVYWTPGCGWILYKVFHREVIVPPGHVVCFTDEHNHHIFAKPGVHNLQNPFLKQRGGPIGLYGTQNHRNIIEHGDRCVFVVPQGMIGYATDMGRPVLLPPGLHCWKSDTLRLERMFRLDDTMPVLQIGPYTILTVEEGMVAITVNHGRQVLLEGGRTHLLTHHKWKLERFVSVKIQSEDLRQVNVSTADNIVMNVDATCVWKIVNIEKAAIMLTESSTMMRSDISLGTLTDDGNGGGGGSGLSKLRRDVLKETISVIARFVSEVNYTEYFHAVSSAMRSRILSDSDYEMTKMTAEVVQTTIENPMFRHGRLKQCVDDVNEITSEFGVEIVNVSIIAASPANASLMTSLSTSTIASAEALQAETHARGMARTMEIEAQAEAKALLTRAKADAEAEVLRSQSAKDAELLRAQGVKEAAKLIESSPLAVTLETIKASAMAIKDSDKFFFGQHPDYMPNLMRSDNH